MFTRKTTKKIKVGGVMIGGGSPIAVQSMTNTDTCDVAKTVAQIRRLEQAGCDIVRVAVPTIEAAQNIRAIKRKIHVPLVADIHFDHRLALESIRQGADKIRINPGNIGGRDKVAAVVLAAKKAKIPIRIGANAGSLKKMHGLSSVHLRARALVDAVLENVILLESLRFNDVVVALKASDVATSVEAYRLFAEKKNYPLHVGITESGSLFRGTIKSAVGLGIMLAQGLGDTMRVSLTAEPEEEVHVAYHILQSLGLRSTGIDIISCPTCSRCEVDLAKIVEALENELKTIVIPPAFRKKPLKIAVMGCVVNGPGEAQESTLGIAGGKDTGLLFKNGKKVGKVPPHAWVKTLVTLVKQACKDNA